MNLIILDVVFPDFKYLDKTDFRKKETLILALTPSSFYYLEKNGINFLSFHDLISREEFRENILKLNQDTLRLNQDIPYTKGFLLYISQYLNYYCYIDKIIEYIHMKNYINIHYVSDRKPSDEILNNSSSLLFKYFNFNKITQVNKASNEHKKTYYSLIKEQSIVNIIRKIKNKVSKYDLKYDWQYINPAVMKKKIQVQRISHSFKIPKLKFIKESEVSFSIKQSFIFEMQYLTFLTKDQYIALLQQKKYTNRKLLFFQHGSYLYKNIFIKYAEIDLASVNFVFNDYTKKLFEDLGAKKVYSVGSVLFNKPIKEKKKKYDFLYITQGHDYTGNLQYVDFPNSLHSFDGYELYQRHKNIINLFGTKFKDKKIIIRVHPTVITNGVYVPFWELAEPYSNITIDASIPIHNLIEKSKYIISDYFTSDFINRELHYKRDIILFQGAPTPLPEETIEDMKKMFILVDTVDDLEEKVKDIEKITKNRKRYDDIIEYYSSKNCDTKKIVTEILEKELNART